MDLQLLLQYRERLRPYLVPICIFTIGIIILLYGLISLIFSSHSSSESFSSDFPSITPDTVSMQKQIVVDVEGAVMHPGVYQVSTEERFGDAIAKAGGVAPNADSDLVSKTLNLALKVTDGAKIYVPKKGDQSSDTSVGQGAININMASIDQLDSLPGVGQVTAGKIIAGRPFATIDDLVNKKIVSSKVFDQIKALITIY